MAEVYDPLDYANLARNVVGALLDNPLHCLAPKDSFVASGVYAIHYIGALPRFPRGRIELGARKALPIVTHVRHY